jgi:transposase-like protein
MELESRGIAEDRRLECISNPEVSLLNIAEIRTDGGTQNRATDSSIVRQYAALMAAETQFPALTVWFDGTHYWLSDGFHRLAAAKQCGFKFVTAYVRAGSLEDAIWDSFRANSQHGLRRKRSDMMGLIERTLKHTRALSLSNVQIAKHLGIPEPTVRRWRKRLSSSDDDDGSRRVSRKGTSYTLHLKQREQHTETKNLKQKPKQQLRRELMEMRLAGSPEINRLLNVIDHWMAGGSAAECLKLLETLLASLSVEASQPQR